MLRMPDPTLATLAKFDDPKEWDHIEYDVPAFAPHERLMKDEHGHVKATIKVDETRLKKIDKQLAALEADYGVVPVMTLGHRLDPMKFPQTAQPPIIGFARRSGFGSFGPKKIPCIKLTLYFKRGTFETAKEYPFRSVEFYYGGPNKDNITGLALLKTDPMLNLGMTTYSAHYGADSEPAYYFAMGEAKTMDPTKTPTPEDQQVEDDTHQEFEKHFMRCMSKHYPSLKSQYGGAGAPAALSPTNGALPGGPPPGAPPSPPPVGAKPEDEEAARMHAADEQINQAHYGAHIAELKRMVATLQQQLAAKDSGEQLAKYERDLTQLRAAGYVFSLARKMEHVKNYNGTGKAATDAQFKEFCIELQNDCRKDPTAAYYERDGQAVHMVRVEESAQGDKLSDEQAERAGYMQGQHPDWTWEKCVEESKKPAAAAA